MNIPQSPPWTSVNIHEHLMNIPWISYTILYPTVPTFEANSDSVAEDALEESKRQKAQLEAEKPGINKPGILRVTHEMLWKSHHLCTQWILPGGFSTFNYHDADCRRK